VQTESQCRARFGIWVGESTASRLSFDRACGARQGSCRDGGMQGDDEQQGCRAARPTTVYYTSSTHRANAGATLPGPLAICFKDNTSAARQRASFPKGRRDPVARTMQVAMFEATGGLGCAVSERACIGSLIGNRLVVRLC
jgi:hypothetical protein